MVRIDGLSCEGSFKKPLPRLFVTYGGNTLSDLFNAKDSLGLMFRISCKCLIRIVGAEFGNVRVPQQGVVESSFQLLGNDLSKS